MPDAVRPHELHGAVATPSGIANGGAGSLDTVDVGRTSDGHAEGTPDGLYVGGHVSSGRLGLGARRRRAEVPGFSPGTTIADKLTRTMDVPTLSSQVAAVEPAPVWRLATRVAFRFCFVYFGLYILLGQMNFIPFIPPLQRFAPIEPTVMWVIKNVFHDDRTLQVFGGSGDKMFDWVFVLCLLTFSAVVTLLWSVIDRRRHNYVWLQKWFRVYLRFGVATTMLGYGMQKAIPLQMPAPSLTRLLEPYGNFSPMGVLWASIGASFPYERVVGLAELLAAGLLFIPQTVLLGGLVSLADSIQIFTLNMTYDVPVKLFSFHLVLLSLLILAPDARRLLNLFVFNKVVEPSRQPPLGRRRRVIQFGIVAQLLLGVYFFWGAYQSANQAFYTRGGGAPRPPLYGVWVIEKMAIDGVERAPLVTDYDRWRRVVIQSGTTMNFWRMDDTTFGMPAQYDLAKKTITLTQGVGAQAKTLGAFAFDQPAPDRLVLDGELNGKNIRMETRLFPRESFLLVNRGFHWIQELPFNR